MKHGPEKSPRWIIEREIRYDSLRIGRSAADSLSGWSGTAGDRKLIQEANDGARLAQENTIKMKIKQVQPQVPPTPTLPLAPS